MIPLSLGISLSQSACFGMLATLLGSTTLIDNNAPSIQPIPVLEVIKVYGKLAGPECYGKNSPPASSCEVTLKDLEKTFELGSKGAFTEQEFLDLLNRAEFQWPLKPYGIDKSLAKTATMNKGAETKVYMDLLEERGLYDRRNPAGPLPTSLRPRLNSQLQKEGVNEDVAHKVYELMGGRNDKLQAEQIAENFGGGMDYYIFLELIGKESVVWPY
jgi:hypothetical protein